MRVPADINNSLKIIMTIRSIVTHKYHDNKNHGYGRDIFHPMLGTHQSWPGGLLLCSIMKYRIQYVNDDAKIMHTIAVVL